MQNLTITISELALGKLQALAAGNHKAVEEIAGEWIEQLALEEAKDEVLQNPLLMIASAMDEFAGQSKSNDVAERSREILDTEFPDYITRRTHGQENDTANSD